VIESGREAGKTMNYVLFAIGCYIILRALQVLLEEHLGRRWCRTLIKAWTIVTLYAALVGLIAFYTARVYFLGFPPGS
jgi:hypothetical protein